MRGRKPAPTNIKILNGTRPDRIPQDEPEGPPGAPICPPYIAENDEARAEWERILPLLESMGVLSQVDGAELALYCSSHAMLVQAEEEIREKGLTIPTGTGGTKTNPAVGIARDARTQCHRLLLEFGCTPSARSRLNAGKKAAKKDALASFKARRPG